MSVNEDIRGALREALLNDSELVAALDNDTAVYHQVAPQGSAAPYVVFDKGSGLTVWTFGDFSLNMLWRVIAVCRGGDASVAETIDERCAVALNDVELDLASGTTLCLYRTGDIEYGDIDNGEQIHYVGGEYRLQVQP